MGCCASVPSHDEDGKTKNKRQSEHEPQKTKNGDSSSIPSVSNNHSTEKPTDLAETWPIFVRLSSNGQDIKIQVPTHPPYLTVSGLRQKLLPHFEKNATVKLIYLGRILSDQHSIIPTETDDDTPLPPPKKKLIQIQREGVIQALITNPT